MDTILVKLFAAALALSEVLTQPQAVKTHFDPVQDQAAVVQILRNGCEHMKQAFDIESINLDDLISTALNDPKAAGATIPQFHGLNFGDLNAAYHQFCKNEAVTTPVVDLSQVIDFFNRAATDLPDPATLKGRKLPSLSVVLDEGGKDFADVFQPGNRRIWIPLADVPDVVQKAFIAAEDRRFYQHHGVDERGIIRAFIGDLADPGRPQGGSTITQQVVKNLLVGEDVTFERKIREMIVASGLENTLTKNDILELYLNSAYLGRASWGIEMAARSYFGKSAKDLTIGEGAMLAGLLKGPNYYNPDRHPARTKDRLTYVLDRMQEDGVITAAQKNQALASPPKLVPFARPHRDSGFHFVDFLGREAKADGVASLTADSYTVHSTINAQLQRDTEAALQEGLARYEISTGRARFGGPEANIADAVAKREVDNKSALPAWQQALQAVHLPLYDVHWTPAVVLEKGGKHGDGAIHVGLPDGRIVPLTTWSAAIRRELGLYDVVYVDVVEPRYVAPKHDGRTRSNAAAPTAQAQLRVRPTVQGAALVLENKTGRILAMAGSFSYPLSQLNRTAQTERQPGSAMKPVTYLTALQRGLQPNTLIPNEPITFPPIGSGIDNRDVISREFGGGVREEDYWSPHNDDYSEGGVYTLRRGLEYSINVVTAHLLDGGVDASPENSLDDICATAVAAKIYPQCVRYYPFILGAQPVKMIDLAAFYAAIANEGALPQPHGIDSIEQDGRTIYQYPNTPLPRIGAADPAAFYQLKSLLQGVVARGTARGIASLSPYVAGKTGTTENFVDGWFVGFTNDVTVAVWVGYDNADGKRRSLGPNEDGAHVAVPIFRPIIEAVWADHVAPKEPLSGPTPAARRDLVDIPIDYVSGNRMQGGNFIEHFRRGADGQVADTQYQLLSQDDAYAYQGGESNPYWGGAGDNSGRSYYPNRGWQPLPSQPPPQQPMSRGLFGLFRPWGAPPPPPNQGYFWGGR
ncbi:MAG TPA: transglycosylase domain-containing protein [Xanthobacteraceae bacterium]|nr:transglycosylase domain-containing protein [Xanthobacteraceae bacterium]